MSSYLEQCTSLALTANSFYLHHFPFEVPDGVSFRFLTIDRHSLKQLSKFTRRRVRIAECLVQPSVW